MKFSRATLETCGEAAGAVVVIDVIRAFTTAAYAFAGGADAVILVSTVQEALALRAQRPGSLVMGESGGLPVENFDFSNSPAAIDGWDLSGRLLIQRTSAGTQGAVRSLKAEHLLAGSLAVAAATARYIQRISPDSITFVLTGVGTDTYPPGAGDEDAACADYIEALLRGQNPDPALFSQRVRASVPGRIFADPNHPEFPAGDLEYCAQVDRFDFAMPIRREGGLLVMSASK